MVITKHSKQRIVERTDGVTTFAEAKRLAKQARNSGKTLNHFQKYPKFFSYLQNKKNQTNDCSIRVYRGCIYIWRGKNKALVTLHIPSLKDILKKWRRLIMKLWIDDLRPAPFGYRIARSVNEAIEIIETYEIMHRMSGGKKIYEIELIDIDHDAGDFFQDGGDYIKILDWMEATDRNYPIHIHSMNPVGIENMRRIIQRNRWREI